MSTEKKDTTFTVIDGGAEPGASDTESVKDAFVEAKASDEKVVVTQTELDALGGLLETFKNILLGHEIRLNNVEQIAGNLVEHTKLPIPGFTDVVGAEVTEGSDELSEHSS